MIRLNREPQRAGKVPGRLRSRLRLIAPQDSLSIPKVTYAIAHSQSSEMTL